MAVAVNESGDIYFTGYIRSTNFMTNFPLGSYNLPNNTKSALLVIHDMKGSLIRSVQIDKNSTSLSLPVQEFENGVYLWNIELDGISRVKGKSVIIK